MVLPSTGEKAFVQVKSQTEPDEFNDYVAAFQEDGLHTRMFYVFHSGTVFHPGTAKTDDPRVIVIGPEKLADLVMEAGLAGWLIQKVS